MLVSNFLILTIVIFCESKSVSVDTLKPAENNATTSNINFVEEIKQDLKRNNDDYKEMIQQKRLVDNNKETNVVTDNVKDSKSRPVSVNVNRKGYRRSNAGSNQEYDYEDTIKPPAEPPLIVKNINKGTTPLTIRIPQKMKNQTRFDKRHNLILPIPNLIPNIYQTMKNFSFASSINSLKFGIPTSEIPKFINKNKIDKFNKFMIKNQDLFKNFVNSKQAALTQQTTTKGVSIRVHNPKLLKSKFPHKGIKKVKRIGDDYDGELPRAELLDMAPAVGGRIHKQREKGRLCHRHVLMPEGPKYDSKGRWYLPAHELIVRRPYTATRRPVILLPRCCNCCKKSVLGCE